MTDPADNWQDSIEFIDKAAAFEGMAENPSRPCEERRQLAMQATVHLHEHITALEAELTQVRSDHERNIAVHTTAYVELEGKLTAARAETEQIRTAALDAHRGQEERWEAELARAREQPWRDYSVEPDGTGDYGAQVVCRSDAACEWTHLNKPGRYLTLGEAADAARQHVNWHAEQDAADSRAGQAGEEMGRD